MTDYQKYQLQWMINHGYSIDDLIFGLSNMQNSKEDSDKLFAPITELFDEWVMDVGFGSEIWACKSEWLNFEGHNAIDWFYVINDSLRDYSDGYIWSNCGDEIMCKSQSIAEAIADVLESLA